MLVSELHLSLDKDNEEQGKYCPSYPKPPVLEMRWENHDIF